MFTWKVDNDISLNLVHEAFASQYAQLAATNKDYLSQWLAWPQFCTSEDDFKAFVKNSLHKYADGINMNCAIQYRGAIVGNIGFNSINHSLKKVEIGYWITEDAQGKGIITRSCQHLIRYAFEQLGMDKIQISAAENNMRSRAVCERLGMTLEGVITNAEKLDTRIVNHAIYGLYRTEIG